MKKFFKFCIAWTTVQFDDIEWELPVTIIVYLILMIIGLIHALCAHSWSVFNGYMIPFYINFLIVLCSIIGKTIDGMED